MYEHRIIKIGGLIQYCIFSVTDKTWMHTPEALSKHYIPYNAKVNLLLGYYLILLCYMLL